MKKKHLFRQSKYKEIYFAIRKILKNFEGHDHWHCRYITFSVIYIFFKVGEIMLLKYRHLMQPAGYIIDLYCVQYCVWLSNAVPFCEDYTKLYFDSKHLKKGLNRRGKIYVALFSKNCPFSIKSALFHKKCSFFHKKVPFSGQYQTLPWIFRICPDQIHFQIKLPLILILWIK